MLAHRPQTTQLHRNDGAAKEKCQAHQELLLSKPSFEVGITNHPALHPNISILIVSEEDVLSRDSKFLLFAFGASIFISRPLLATSFPSRMLSKLRLKQEHIGS